MPDFFSRLILSMQGWAQVSSYNREFFFVGWINYRDLFEFSNIRLFLFGFSTIEYNLWINNYFGCFPTKDMQIPHSKEAQCDETKDVLKKSYQIIIIIMVLFYLSSRYYAVSKEIVKGIELKLCHSYFDIRQWSS